MMPPKIPATNFRHGPLLGSSDGFPIAFDPHGLKQIKV